MPLASLAMYVSPPPVARATAAFWHALSARLRQAGLDAPEHMDESLRYDQAWLHPDLLFAQTCGYPYVRYLRGKVQLVGTPIYTLPGCDGPLMCSFIIVQAEGPIRTVSDLRDRRAAINERGSNSGYNLFRAFLAPHAGGNPFFSAVLETGGHRASIDAVASGQADVAAIDCVTFGHIKRFEPERVASLRILAETAKGPGLPFITASTTSQERLAQLRQTLSETISDPSLAPVCKVLSLSGIARLDDRDYEALAEMDKQAARLGYPAIV
ncbi:phosphate ABC transporter substrate-binding protein [Xaviernesmea oryzae]|uniref:Phosphate ABC transporter substrate-binding protein n=1 Tax=Xaviernesmea oryzae TaxID=464029 RepID=A0A1Q9AQT8_9HYPH|nr:PhnD/SsuA/transferrin family substrate-binding protein [Xaviernesmea oryzae]OLP57780.1 phosphate ABC transporter substrate-binding protein [Xaviernesmea oryzae]SEL37259.1 ABC-type phosphate/phosphonate transport system, substrate-binding protein [Xaviernesmea oryzae]